jgi:hypothetical protein
LSYLFVSDNWLRLLAVRVSEKTAGESQKKLKFWLANVDINGILKG